MAVPPSIGRPGVLLDVLHGALASADAPADAPAVGRLM
jgi:hypothetical protein